ELPQPRARDVLVDVPLAAARQWLQRSHPGRFPPDGTAHQRVSGSGIVRDHAGAGSPLRPVARGYLQPGCARRARGSHGPLRGLPASDRADGDGLAVRNRGLSRARHTGMTGTSLCRRRARWMTAPASEKIRMSAAPTSDSASADSARRPRRAKYSVNVASRTPNPLTDTGTIWTMNERGIRTARWAVEIGMASARAMAT